MKSKLLVTALLLAFLSVNTFAQGKQTKLSPIDYNDQMVEYTDSLYKLGQQWGVIFANVNKGDHDFSKLAPARKKMADYIKRSTEKVKREPAIGKGGEKLKAAILDFLKFENSMIDIAFLDMEKLNTTSSQADIDAALKKLVDLAAQEGEVLKKVNIAQEEYAGQNGFAIESAPEAE